MYEKISSWLDGVFGMKIPDGVVSICFNLYEDGDNSWSLEVVGCSSFDSDDSDWACDEVTDFETRDDPFTWKDESNWEKVLHDIRKLLYQYIQDGGASEYLKTLEGIAVGFVDGNLIVLAKKE